MSLTRRRVVFCTLCLFAAVSVGATPLAACDPVWLPISRPDGISVFVALAFAERVVDIVGAPIAARVHPAFARRLGAVSGQSPGGQRVRLLHWRGSSSVAGEAVLVPWAYREDCRPIAWADRLDWIPPGTRGAFTGWLRPREHWLDGVPTFDVEMAWREPMWAEDEPRWSTAGGDRRMTPEEFTTLYMALPTDDRWTADPRQAAAQMRRWKEDHPLLAALAPATTLLANIERAAEQEHQDLSGRWTVELRVQESRELPLPVMASTVTGELRLQPVTPAPAVEGAGPEAVYTGRSMLDLSALGFRLGSDEVLVTLARDEVRMILDPSVDHGHVVAVMTGAGDTLVGTWYLNSRPARARGSITLRRVR